jgi:hypothetical protein
MKRDELLQQLANTQYPKRGDKMDTNEINKILADSVRWEGRYLDGEDLKDPIVKLRTAITSLISINEKLILNVLAYSKQLEQLKAQMAKIEDEKNGPTG